MGFSGAWLKSNFFVDPPTPLHESDPSHFLPEAGDPTLGAWAGPAILQDGSYDYLQGESVAFVVDTPGLEMDFTPEDHNEGYGGPNYREWFTEPTDAAAPGDLAQIQASALAHGTDYGAAFESTYAAPPFQSSDERYLSWRFEGFGPIELPALAGGGQRGLNSYAVNNPPLESYDGHGYRFGWVEQNAVDRKMYDATRVHDERMITANTATVMEDQPVPDNAGPYNEPFTTFARAFTRPQTPMMRRQPPPMDQSIMVDGTGTDELYDADSDWVMG